MVLALIAASARIVRNGHDLPCVVPVGCLTLHP